ncbi:MAG: (4Fe-4S)-binding protein [Dehalococcoidia bacterium]|nr:(4Fe-4S)-binding protein [Dehalococcoidia bacterium]
MNRSIHMGKQMRRVYENDKIRVFWDNTKCTHSAKCVNGLPGVFNMNNSPWVNVNGAEAAEITRVVDACPSGALRYELLREPGRSAGASEPTNRRQSQGQQP